MEDKQQEELLMSSSSRNAVVGEKGFSVGVFGQCYSASCAEQTMVLTNNIAGNQVPCSLWEKYLFLLQRVDKRCKSFHRVW